MRLTLISDAWTPQVNGVVRTLKTTIATLEQQGHAVQTITPDLFRSLPCPTYPEIRLALASRRRVARMIESFQPAAIHIATEGPLGLAARRYCLKRKLPFTTAFHTRFPDYVSARTGLSPDWFWRYLRWFHAPAAAVLAATPRLAAELNDRGILSTRPWSRGVDLAQFRPEIAPHPAYADLPRPLQLYVGRVAVEKNVEAFLATRQPGTRVVVGDGPALDALQTQYPDAVFLGALHGEALASAYAGADVFVFPSKTDTFGLVMIEALASGLPVAGYPIQGPLDVIGPEGRGVIDDWTQPVGAVDESLDAAIAQALTCQRDDCVAYARHFSWEASSAQFLAALAPLVGAPLAGAPDDDAARAA